MQHLLGFELLRHNDIPLFWSCYGPRDSTDHKENFTTPSETVNGFIRDSGGSFLWICRHLGAGEEGNPPLVLGIWTPPSWSSSSPWSINNKGSESDVRIGHKLVTPRSRGVTRVTKMASECRRIKVFFLSPANLRLCLYERFIARARFTLYALLCIISWDHGIFTDRNMEYENVWRASIILG